MRQGTTPALLALVLLGLPVPSPADEWTLPDSLKGVRVAPIFLLSRPDVQADLGLTGEQVLSVQRAVQDLYDRAADLRGLSDVEAIAGRRAIDEAQRRWLETQIDEDQRSRLIQLDLQWEGPTAIASRSWVADYLGLTPAQRQRLEALPHRPDPSAPPPSEAVLTVLNAEQQARWQAMLGAPLGRRAPATASAPTAPPR